MVRSPPHGSSTSAPSCPRPQRITSRSSGHPPHCPTTSSSLAGSLSVEDIEDMCGAMRELGTTAKRSPLFTRLLAARDPSSAAQPLSAASVRRVHATLMSALSTAAKRRLIPFNPGAYVELAAEGGSVDGGVGRGMAQNREAPEGGRLDS